MTCPPDLASARSGLLLTTCSLEGIVPGPSRTRCTECWMSVFARTTNVTGLAPVPRTYSGLPWHCTQAGMSEPSEDVLGCYNLQVNRKTREGKSHPDRDAQFEYIAKQVRSFQRRGQPVVSVDTKKKELVGDFKNAGQEWQPEGSPEEVRCKDFKDKELGKVAPYGIYDQTIDEGWVSVGIDHDTAQFATETLRRWWSHMGIRVYPRATDVLVTADGGGSNSSRSRLWKLALQGLADEIGLRMTVCHFPQGPASGTRSSTECSAISRRIGVVGR
jgi:Rhodopirellula transposase DDE domain